jgi:hypothetical protein
MADQKISELTAATSVSGTDITAVVQSSTTKSAALSVIKDYILGVATTTKVSGSNFTTSSTSLVDITGLTFAASANTKYEIDGMLLGQSGSAGGVQFAVSFSAAGATGSYMAFSPSTSSASGGGVNVIGTATGQNVWTTTTTDLHTFIKSIVSVGANSGNITVQVKKTTSGSLTVYIGSRMTVTTL